MGEAVASYRALGLAKWALRLVIALCAALFLFYVVAIATDAWVSTSIYHALTNATVFPYIGQADKEGLARISEQRQYSSAVWFLWGLLFVAALLTILLRRVCALEMGYRQDVDGGPAEILAKHSGRLAAFKSAVKRVLHYQLPPRRFWFWWSDGFQVYDALVVAAWIAVNVLYVEQRTSRMLRMTKYEHFHTDDPDKHQTTGQIYLDFISGALAWAATLDIMLLFLPVPRSTFLHYLLGTGFSSLIKYHRWLGHGTMVLLTLHGWGFWALWIWQGEPARGIGWQPQGTNMLAGAISWLCGAALWVTATSYVRRNYFEVFYRTHILGFLGFIIFGYMHRTNLWAFVTPALALYLLDITFRVAQQAYPVRLQMTSVDSTGQLAQLHIGVDYFTPLHPIQEMYVSAWKLSPLQWHPFTAIPGQQPTTLLSIIKRYGRWTEDLMSRLQKGGEVAVRVDGPYGEAEGQPDYVHYPLLVMFAGGIGVTPVLGIIQDLNRRRAALRKGRTMLPTEAHLTFAGRSLAELDLLQGSIIGEARGAGWLQVQLYQSGNAPPSEPKVDSQKPQLPELERAKGDASSAASSTGSDAMPPYVRRSMPPYSFGDAHWAAAHVLCFAGAVLGSVAAWAYAAEAKRHSKEGAHEWLVGLVLLVASCGGCMLLPALVIIPAHLWRAISLRKLSSKTADASSLADVPTGCSPDVEQPVPRLSIAKGRPDVPSLLADIASNGAKHREIGVIAAGPEPLVNSVKQACAAHNAKVGLAGRPYLHALKYTHTL